MLSSGDIESEEINLYIIGRPSTGIRGLGRV